LALLFWGHLNEGVAMGGSLTADAQN